MREMKDSGYDWLGKIPSNWDLRRGRYLFAQRNEKGNGLCPQLLSPSQKLGVIPQKLLEELTTHKAVKLKEETDLSELKTVHVGDFCISLRSFQGGFEYSKYEGVVSPAYQIFYATDEISNDYYRYLFKDASFIDKMNSYTMSLRDGKNIAFFDFANTFLPVPGLDEQKHIASYLDSKCSKIDAIIEKQQIVIEKMKEYKLSLITETVTKGLNPDVPMKDSGVEWIGEVPEHWLKVKLKNLCSFHNGDRSSNYPNAEDFMEIGVPFIGAGSLNNLFVDINEAKFISNDKYNQMSGLKIQRNDILYTLRGSTIGKNSMVDFDNGTVASSLMGIRVTDSKKLNSKFLLYWLQSNNEYIQRDLCINGSTAPNLSAEDVQQFIAFLPDTNEQLSVVCFLDRKCSAIDATISKKQALIEKLKAYKKSLIYEVVTGKKEV